MRDTLQLMLQRGGVMSNQNFHNWADLACWAVFLEDEINLVIDKVCILLLSHVNHLKVVLPFFQYK